MGVAGANMQWDHFSSRQKRESTAIDLFLRSTWGLSSPDKQVDRGSTPCWKRRQVWGRESDHERWPKYYAVGLPVLEMVTILKNELSPLRIEL